MAHITTALEGRFTRLNMYYETLSEAVRTLWGQRWVRALSEDPHTAPAPNAARDVAFAHVDLGRENAVPPRLSLG